MKVLGRIFINSRTDGKTEFFVRCRRTYVLNNSHLATFLHQRWQFLFNPLNNGKILRLSRVSNITKFLLMNDSFSTN